MPPRASGPPFVDFSVLLPALADHGRDERVVFVRYVKDCAKAHCSVDGWPATVSDSLDSKYPFLDLAVTDRGVTCPAWSVPLPPLLDAANHLFADLEFITNELSGLELRYEPRRTPSAPRCPAPRAMSWAAWRRSKTAR